MAKKVVKKKVSNKKSVKKVVSNKPTLMGAAHAWKGFIFFLVLLLISLISYNVVTTDMYRELFFLLSFAFGAISAALLIALLVYFFYAKIKIRK